MSFDSYAPPAWQRDDLSYTCSVCLRSKRGRQNHYAMSQSYVICLPCRNTHGRGAVEDIILRQCLGAADELWVRTGGARDNGFKRPAFYAARRLVRLELEAPSILLGMGNAMTR